ncbi:unnamed protein product [Closterium sp. Naga37s-1]|nr:unnamed protein product [Closterium sp. Naga37s-1]
MCRVHRAAGGVAGGMAAAADAPLLLRSARGRPAVAEPHHTHRPRSRDAGRSSSTARRMQKTTSQLINHTATPLSCDASQATVTIYFRCALAHYHHPSQACGTTVAYASMYAMDLTANILASSQIAVANVLPCLADSLFRFTYRHSSHLHPLVFPLVSASIWTLLSLLSPFGATAHPFYSLCSLLPLVQATAYVGMDGVLLLVAWLVGGIHQMMFEGDAVGRGEEGWRRGEWGESRAGSGGVVGEEGGGRGEGHVRCPGEGEREGGDSQVFFQQPLEATIVPSVPVSCILSQAPTNNIPPRPPPSLCQHTAANASTHFPTLSMRLGADGGEGGNGGGQGECQHGLIAPNLVTNTFALIDPSGAPILRYNKTHLFPSGGQRATRSRVSARGGHASGEAVYTFKRFKGEPTANGGTPVLTHSHFSPIPTVTIITHRHPQSGHSAAAQLDVGRRSCATSHPADPSSPFPLHPQSGHSAAAQLDVGRHWPRDTPDGCSEGSRERAHTAALLLHWGLGVLGAVSPHYRTLAALCVLLLQWLCFLLLEDYASKCLPTRLPICPSVHSFPHTFNHLSLHPPSPVVLVFAPLTHRREALESGMLTMHLPLQHRAPALYPFIGLPISLLLLSFTLFAAFLAIAPPYLSLPFCRYLPTPLCSLLPYPLCLAGQQEGREREKKE